MKPYLVFGVFMYIYKRKNTRARDIAEYFEVSVKTIYRYLDALSYVGIPVITKQGRNGGIKIDINYKLENACFTAEDKQEIKKAVENSKNNIKNYSKIIKELSY